jgi:hypothetical protein
MPDTLKVEWFLTNDAEFDGDVKTKKLNEKTLKTEKEAVFRSDIAGYHHLKILFPKFQDQFYVKISRCCP